MTEFLASSVDNIECESLDVETLRRRQGVSVGGLISARNSLEEPMTDLGNPS